MKISKCKLIKAVVFNKRSSVLDLAKLLARKKSKQAILVEKNKPFGILTLSDVVYRAVAKNKDLKKTKAKEITTKNIFYLKGSDDLFKAYSYMVNNNQFLCPIIKGKDVYLLTFSESLKRLVKNAR
jgi:predicted transcriptional regulator